MKKVSLLLVLAIALVALPKIPAYADAGKQGCQSSGGRAAACSSDPAAVPKPGSFALLAVGFSVLGGLAVVLRRKRLDVLYNTPRKHRPSVGPTREQEMPTPYPVSTLTKDQQFEDLMRAFSRRFV